MVFPRLPIAHSSSLQVPIARAGRAGKSLGESLGMNKKNQLQ
jgi:hypothetical protein